MWYLCDHDFVSNNKVETRLVRYHRQERDTRNVEKVFAHDKFRHVRNDASVISGFDHIVVCHCFEKSLSYGMLRCYLREAVEIEGVFAQERRKEFSGQEEGFNIPLCEIQLSSEVESSMRSKFVGEMVKWFSTSSIPTSAD